MTNHLGKASISVVACSAFFLASCGGGDSSSTSNDDSRGGAGGAAVSEDGYLRGEVDKSAPLYDELPDDIKSAGRLVVGTSVGYPPFSYFDKNGTDLIGFEPDLSGALSEQLGVPVGWEDAVFSALFTGLEADRFDGLWVGMLVTEEREQQYSMVTYMEAGSGVVVAEGNPGGISSLEDLCGETVAVTRGTSQESFLVTEGENCSEGTIETLALDSDTEGQLQVKQGRAVALLATSPSAVYYAENSDGSLELVEGMENVRPGLYGLMLKQGDTDLAKVLQKGVQGMIDSGSYEEIMTDWQLEGQAVDESLINPLTGS
jgi:polar amino acid transport system substrate-binding protein